MSAGNLGVCIASAAVTAGGDGTGLVQQPIGGYVQASTPPPGPEASTGYLGVNGSTFYNRNVLSEDYTASGGITVLGDSGAAAGKTARWVSNTSALTVAADQLCSVSAGGVVTATATTGLYKLYCAAPAAVIPANSFFWVFLV